MGKYSRPKKSHRTGRTLALLGVLAMVLVLAGLVLLPRSEKNSTPDPAVNVPSTQEAPVIPTLPLFAPVGNHNTESPQCQASYTAPYDESAAKAVVAGAGDATLTAEALQVLYLSQVNAFRAAGQETAPDFSQPLDTQSCPLEEGFSWQQYFLQRAILSWHAQQAVLYAAAQPQEITEEAFQPDATDTLHEKYIADDLPVNNFLYQDQPCYKPNSMHQDYLDQLRTLLDELAGQQGFADLEEMAQKSAHTSADVWVQAATDYNTAYMYFTEVSYALDSDDAAAVPASENAGTASTAGGAEKTVDIRQILVVPQGGQIADDGTVTATDAQWEEARRRAEELLNRWRTGSRRSSEAEFAQLASEESDDAGSKINGGGYFNIHKGQLIQQLDEWCFADDRKKMDREIIRTELGYHLVLLTAFHSQDLENAKLELLHSTQEQQWAQWCQEVPLKVDYSKITLWADTTVQVPTLEDVLYPDVAHQRFPEVMVYLQQDYFYYPLGDRAIGKNGCGITAWAMLATYMTDSLQTPAMMADRFTAFYDNVGHSISGDIFTYAPAEMGFYVDALVFDLDKAVEALQNGQIVVSLQQKGHFTTTGHYLVVTHYNEEDDTFQVRDSNIYNYASKRGHRIDRFTRGEMISGGGHFYIMQRKVTAIPACSRCGGTFETHQPEKLLQEDYLCEKCTAAIARRECFLSILDTASTSGL